MSNAWPWRLKITRWPMAIFEGLIPAKQYGAGHVIVWDNGVWLPKVDAAQGFKDGKLKFELRGHKLQGLWALVRMHSHGEKQIAWLLIKEHDEFEKPSGDYDITQALPESVNSVKSDGQKRAPADVNVAPATSVKRKSTSKNANLPSGAVKASLPQQLAPQLATLVSAPPEQGDWRYEVKFDGYRLLARMGGGVGGDADPVGAISDNVFRILNLIGNPLIHGQI